jgi:trehalose 6-phosphate phosphatase
MHLAARRGKCNESPDCAFCLVRAVRKTGSLLFVLEIGGGMDSTRMGATTRLGPVSRKDWALFLDLDGTLIDIAEEPGAVVVPKTLAPTLISAHNWLDGALAIVSGRSLAEIDRLLAPLRLPCAGEHGAEIRLPQGENWSAGARYAVPDAWREQLRDGARPWNGVIVENKAYGVALHFRKAPARAGDVLELAEKVVGTRQDEFRILPGHMSFEIRHRSLHKGRAVAMFLGMAPFRGRVPVFVGDDVTDEDGFCAARERGGLGLHVRDAFQGKPSEVRRWLGGFGRKNAGGT